jgi:hypothetical protein
MVVNRETRVRNLKPQKKTLLNLFEADEVEAAVDGEIEVEEVEE